MRAVPLGTSSGRPTTERNVSALAVDLGPQWLLVDCGEGTQHQLLRSDLRPSRLAAVLITHLHGDHVLGLPGLLSSLGIDGRTEPITVVAPAAIGPWLAASMATPILQLPFAVDVRLLDEDAVDADGPPVEVLADDGFSVHTLPLAHRVPCFGYRIAEPRRPGKVDRRAAAARGVPDGPDLGRLQRGETVTTAAGPVTPDGIVGPPRPGRVVTVLGDTVPCAAAVRLGADADLIVHEATYADEHLALAEQWRHATASGAAAVARDAGARRLLITHFSARYPDEHGLLAEARSVFAATDPAVELRPVDVPTRDG